MTTFQVNDPSLESQWRAIILFGKNSATYKFALAKCLLELVEQQRTSITLAELAEPYSGHLIEHLRNNDKQGNSESSKFLNTCRAFIDGKVSKEDLVASTERLGFVNVIDAFQVVNSATIPNPFYENGKKKIILTDNLLSLKESFQFQNIYPEVEGRWKLVETAWNLQINPNLLEVQYDEGQQIFFLENDFMRRKDITSVRSSLNGYQKGKCFYSFQDISIVPLSSNLCHVDHFLPHLNKKAHGQANINGVWNLVLADSKINLEKNARVPAEEYLKRLYKRNEFFIESKHPLGETIINQTGKTPREREAFLREQHRTALDNSIHIWKPSIEMLATF